MTDKGEASPGVVAAGNLLTAFVTMMLARGANTDATMFLALFDDLTERATFSPADLAELKAAINDGYEGLNLSAG